MSGIFGPGSRLHEQPILQSAVGNRKGGEDGAHEGEPVGILEAWKHHLGFRADDARPRAGGQEKDEEEPLHWPAPGSPG